MPYPATIQTEDENWVNFLKKLYYRTDILDIALQLEEAAGQISNKWFSNTPSEFREKLAEAFNLESVGILLVNLSSINFGTPGNELDGIQSDLAEN